MLHSSQRDNSSPRKPYFMHIRYIEFQPSCFFSRAVLCCLATKYITFCGHKNHNKNCSPFISFLIKRSSFFRSYITCKYQPPRRIISSMQTLAAEISSSDMIISFPPPQPMPLHDLYTSISVVIFIFGQSIFFERM